MRKFHPLLAVILGLSAILFVGCARMQASRNVQSQTLADILAVCVRAPISFRDAESAKDTLSALSRTDGVVYAAVLNRDKSVLAEYSKEGSNISGSRMHAAIDESIPESGACCTKSSSGAVVVAPVTNGQETIGYVALVSRGM
jgi:hypothetical protein